MNRVIRYLAVAVLAAVVMACAPAAPPTPTSVPPKPAPAAPAAAPTVAPKPAAPAPTAAPAKPAAVAPTAAPAKPAAAKEKVIMRLGWTIQGANAPFLLAWAKGWYEAEGLDVEIHEGKGSMTGFQTVASGADTFTYGDPGVVMQAIQQGLPVRGIALLLARSPMAVVAQKEANVKGPKDLEGKSVAVTPGDTAMVMLPALLKANKGDIAKVNQVSLDANGKTAAFVGKRVDAATTFVNSSLVPMQKAVPDLTMFLYADYGVDTGGVVLVTNLPTIRERPQVVRGFTKATVRAFQYTRENKKEGIDAIMKRFPVADRALMEAQWDRTLVLLDSDASKKAGPGVIFPELFSSNQDLLLEYGQLKEKRTIDQYFSNDFVK